MSIEKVIHNNQIEVDSISWLSLPIAEDTRQTNCWSELNRNIYLTDLTKITNNCLLSLYKFYIADFQTKRYSYHFSSLNNTWKSYIKSVKSLNSSTPDQTWEYIFRLIDYPSVAAVFAFMVKPLGYVENVVVKGKDGKYNIWTIVNNSTLEQRYAIYDRQWEVMQYFKGVKVEFNLIDREDSPLENIITWDDETVVIEG